MNKKPVWLIGVGAAIVFLIFFVTRNNKPKSTLTDSQTTQVNYQTQEKSINVGDDVCGEFSKEWVASVVGKTIIKTEKLDSSGTHVCQYYTDDSNFITLRLNNLNVENQKKGQIALGRTITTNEKIKMEHFVVMQSENVINEIILVINPNRFIAVDRTSTKAATEDELVNFASQVSNRINNNENVPVIGPTKKTENTVPLPQETDIARTFFNLIGEHKPSDAVMMMTPVNTNDDSAKQAWAVQFNAFESMSVKSIEPSMQEDWTETVHSYKVTLNVKMKPEAANAVPMPNYGWDNGENYRWVTLEKINSRWMVGGIATGP